MDAGCKNVPVQTSGETDSVKSDSVGNSKIPCAYAGIVADVTRAGCNISNIARTRIVIEPAVAEACVLYPLSLCRALNLPCSWFDSVHI